MEIADVLGYEICFKKKGVTENIIIPEPHDTREQVDQKLINKLAVKILNITISKLDDKDYRVYCILGDGEIEEGQIWEAAMASNKYKLDNLCVIVDNNNLQIDGTIEEVMSSYPIDKKFEAFGFNVINIDGHNFEQIKNAFSQAKQVKDKPTCIIAKTIKGKGVSFMENEVGWHGKAPNEEQYNKAMEDLK